MPTLPNSKLPSLSTALTARIERDTRLLQALAAYDESKAHHLACSKVLAEYLTDPSLSALLAALPTDTTTRELRDEVAVVVSEHPRTARETLGKYGDG